jgi:hypothetical protein
MPVTCFGGEVLGFEFDWDGIGVSWAVKLMEIPANLVVTTAALLCEPMKA